MNRFSQLFRLGRTSSRVSNRDSIYVEKLKFCEVNDKLILNKVLMLGSASQTIVGRPIVPEAAVHAVVEEHVSSPNLSPSVCLSPQLLFAELHYLRGKGLYNSLTKALDAKVIIFKKKRRKNYCRTKGHRQELTKLRITDIQGIEKPEKVATMNPENVAVAA